MKTLKYILLGLGVVLTPIAIYSYSQYKKALETCYLTAGIVLHNISYNLLSFTLLLKIKNTTDVAIILKNQHYDIYFLDVKVAEASRPDKQVIHANSCSPFSIDVSFSPSKVLGNILSSLADIIKNKEKIKIKVVAIADINTMGFTKKNFHYETTLTLKDLLDEEPNSDGECKC